MWRRLSAEAEELIRQLRKRPRWWQRLTPGRHQERRRLLSGLVARRELASVVSLVELATDEDPEVARTAMTAVATLVGEVPRCELPRLDEAVREGMSQWCEPMGRWPAPGELDVHDEAAIACLGVVSCVWDGHTREAAVARLGQAATPQALPWLLLRVNDWVPAVRIRASTAVAARVTVANAGTLVANLELVMRLETCGRADHAPLIAAVTTVLRQPAAREAALHGLAHGARGVRELCAESLLGAEDVDPLQVARRVRGDPAVRVRLLAARACRRRLATGAFAAAFEVLRADPFPPVRMEMLEGLVEHEPAVAGVVLPAALLDRSAGVRETVRYLLKRANAALDVRALYQEQLAHANGLELAVCLFGLAEAGSKSDAATVRTFVRHPVASVRRAAANALARLAPDGDADLFRTLIHDRSAGVSRAASDALRQRLHLVEPGALWRAFEQAEATHVRRQLLFLFERLPKWRQLDFLRAVAITTATERQRAVGAVESWLNQSNRSFVAPSVTETEAVRAALESARPALPLGVTERVAWILGA